MASWHCDEWPLHVRLRILQTILIPYLLYFIPLLDWKPAHFAPFETAFKRFLWGNKGKTCAFIKWDIVCQPKTLGGLGVLNLSAHAHARRATMMKHMFTRDTLWARCMWQIIGYAVVYFHGTWQLSDWDKMFSHAPLKTDCPTAQLFIVSWKHVCSFLIWEGRARYTGNSIGQENVFWSFLFQVPPCYSIGKLSLTLFKKGIHCINQMIDSEGKFVLFLIARREFRLGHHCRQAWNELCAHTFKLQIPPNENLWERFRDWQIPYAAGNWWRSSTAQFYRLLLPHQDIESRCNKLWRMHKQ